MKIKQHKLFLKDFKKTTLSDRDFHLSGDMLVIYLVNQNSEIILMRLGTHSQLF